MKVRLKETGEVAEVERLVFVTKDGVMTAFADEVEWLPDTTLIDKFLGKAIHELMKRKKGHPKIVII